jgi:hypothetical protein
MMDPEKIPPVDNEEWLARFATQSSLFRPGDKTVKQDLFMPNANGKVSVMRHREVSEEEIWAVGRTVASAIGGRTLYGRSDVRAADCRNLALSVRETPNADNPNHADIMDWPDNKADQKAIAQKLAAAASKLIPPG